MPIRYTNCIIECVSLSLVESLIYKFMLFLQVRGRPWPVFVTERLGYTDALGGESYEIAFSRFSDPDPDMASSVDEASE